MVATLLAIARTPLLALSSRSAARCLANLALHPEYAQVLGRRDTVGPLLHSLAPHVEVATRQEASRAVSNLAANRECYSTTRNESRTEEHPTLATSLAFSQLTGAFGDRFCAALCRVILMREGALNASVAILVQANGLESKLASYALKTVTLFAQNQFRKFRPKNV